MRRPALLLAVVTAALVLPSPGSAAGPCVTTDAGGGWLASRPAFASGDKDVTLVASPAYAPDLLYASNGTLVSRSEDGGCTWQAAFTADDARGLIGGLGTARVTSLAAPSSATSSRFVYLGLTVDLPGGVTLPRVAVSTDRGVTWAASDEESGLPLAGEVAQVAANPTVPQVAFAVGGAGTPVLSATQDTGATWAQRTEAGSSADVKGLLPDPLVQTRLYGVQGDRVVRSDNGGTTFARVAGDAGEVSQLRGAAGAGGFRLAAARFDASAVVSEDGGDTWRVRRLPVRPTSLGVGPLSDTLAVSDPTQTFLVPSTGPALPIPADTAAPQQLSLSAPQAAGLSVTGVALGAVLRLAVATDAAGRPRVLPVLPGLRPVQLQSGGPVDRFPALLAPSALTVSLPAGGRQLVPYRLLVPRTPTPVDLMFLIDTTGSMASVIDGLRQDLARIVTMLDTAGLDARFGLGDFRDYADPRDTVDYPYKRRRAIGPNDASLRRALDGLDTGGGGDGLQSGFTALLQSTTGKGQDPWIPAGQQAGYRPGAFKIALISTDVPFHRAGDEYSNVSGRSTWPGPSRDGVIRALRKAGVHQVGLAVGTGPMGDMQVIARETDTLAPAGGLDCDGDGLPELREGSPLVCQIDGGVGVGVSVNGSGLPGGSGATALAGAVVGAANGITDDQRVTVRVKGPAGFAQLRATPASAGSDTLARVLNLKADNELAYLLELRCPAAGPPSQQALGLEASARGSVLVGAAVTLRCGGAAALTPAAPVAAQPAPPAVQQAPAAAQPIQQPAPNPNPNPQANPNVQPGANLNAAGAQQQESQGQLAFAASEAGEAGEVGESLAMSAAFLGAAGLLLSCATGVVVRRRVQEQRAENPV